METPPIKNPNPIERARIKKGIAKLALANRSGVARSTLDRRIEHPELTTLSELSALAGELGVSSTKLAAQILADYEDHPSSLAA